MGGSGRALAVASVATLTLLSVASLALVSDDGVAPAPDVAPQPLYERHDDCKSVPCFSSAAEDRFIVAAGVSEISFVVYAVLDDATGPARLTIVDPSGDVRYERLLVPEEPSLRAAFQDVNTWEAELGEWTLTRSYLGTSGTIHYDAWGVGTA